jgi:uncharacterized protein YhbP (UPF0306 family)
MINDPIRKFIEAQTCATVCCGSIEPSCFTCFYSFNAGDVTLYFKSSPATAHIALLKENPLVAGTILPDKLNSLIVRGIQFKGIAISPGDPLTKHAAVHYHKKHPLALAMKGEVWAIRFTEIKMTDSSRLFDKKISWNRQGEPLPNHHNIIHVHNTVSHHDCSFLPGSNSQGDEMPILCL